MVHRAEKSGHSSSIGVDKVREGTSTIEYGNTGLRQSVIGICRRKT